MPAQNIVYADREGHIGYQAPGLVPIRKSGQRRPDAGGGLASARTTGPVSSCRSTALPNVLDPDEGFIVTANQAVIGEDYPYFLTDDWDRGYRSERIRDLLEDRRGRAVGRGDARPPARHPQPDGAGAGALPARRRPAARLLLAPASELLRDWDFEQAADSAAAAYYNVVWRNLLDLTFHDELPEDVWPDGGQRWLAVMTRLLDDPATRGGTTRRPTRSRDPRRHPAAGDAGRPRRADPPAGA